MIADIKAGDIKTVTDSQILYLEGGSVLSIFRELINNDHNYEVLSNLEKREIPISNYLDVLGCGEALIDRAKNNICVFTDNEIDGFIDIFGNSLEHKLKQGVEVKMISLNKQSRLIKDFYLRFPNFDVQCGNHNRKIMGPYLICDGDVLEVGMVHKEMQTRRWNQVDSTLWVYDRIKSKLKKEGFEILFKHLEKLENDFKQRARLVNSKFS